MVLFGHAVEENLIHKANSALRLADEKIEQVTATLFCPRSVRLNFYRADSTKPHLPFVGSLDPDEVTDMRLLQQPDHLVLVAHHLLQMTAQLVHLLYPFFCSK